MFSKQLKTVEICSWLQTPPRFWSAVNIYPSRPQISVLGTSLTQFLNLSLHLDILLFHTVSLALNWGLGVTKTATNGWVLVSQKATNVQLSSWGTPRVLPAHMPALHAQASSFLSLSLSLIPPPRKKFIYIYIYLLYFMAVTQWAACARLHSEYK